MKNHILLAFLLVSLSMSAQTEGQNFSAEVDTLFQPKLTGETFLQESGYKGEQYFYGSWLDGDILLSTGEMVYNKKIKYNGYLDEVIWLISPDVEQIKLDRAFIREFWLKKETESPAHFKRISVNDTTASRKSDLFLEVGTEGKVSFYIQRRYSHLIDESTSVHGQIFNIKFYEYKPLYFIKLQNNKYLTLSKLSRRSFLRLFPTQKKILSKLIRDNHLNLKTENGLSKTIDLINENSISL